MKSRSRPLLAFASCAVATVVLVAPALGDVLFGMITRVDVEAKKVIVAEEETHKEVEIIITNKTRFVTKKATIKADLEKLSKALKKAQDQGRTGVPARVEHTKGAASRISFNPTKR